MFGLDNKKKKFHQCHHPHIRPSIHPSSCNSSSMSANYLLWMPWVNMVNIYYQFTPLLAALHKSQIFCDFGDLDVSFLFWPHSSTPLSTNNTNNKWCYKNCILTLLFCFRVVLLFVGFVCCNCLLLHICQEMPCHGCVCPYLDMANNRWVNIGFVWMTAEEEEVPTTTTTNQPLLPKTKEICHWKWGSLMDHYVVVKVVSNQKINENQATTVATKKISTQRG